jgi:hypothetical protein
MTAPKELVRYHVYERGYGRDPRPELREERWILGPKKAKLLEPNRGYSVRSHAEFNARAETPDAALEQYIARKQKAYDLRVKDTAEAKRALEVAQAAAISGGRLVLQ